MLIKELAQFCSAVLVTGVPVHTQCFFVLFFFCSCADMGYLFLVLSQLDIKDGLRIFMFL